MTIRSFLLSSLICLGGLFFLSAAIFDWSWFLRHEDGPLLSRFMGDFGVRLFYGLLGCCLILISILRLNPSRET